MGTKKSLGMGVKELLKIALKEELETVNRDNSSKGQVESESALQKKSGAPQIAKKDKKQLPEEKTKKTDSADYYQQAIKAYKENQTLLALIKFAAHLEVFADDPRCWNNLGVILFESGAEHLARECFQRALKIDPENQTARENLAQFEE